MDKIIRGVHQFQDAVFGSHKQLFERLSQGQNPDALFITCSDSRIDPSLLTQTSPGEIFVLRNAGNIVPPYGASSGGEAAAVEYAVAALGVRDIIVCGHSQCGAVSGLLNPELVQELPAVSSWLQHAATTKRIVDYNYAELSAAERMTAAIKENVLVQLDNLRTHPSVASRLSRRELNLHAWVYEFEHGTMFSYCPDERRFRQFGEESEELASAATGAAN
jgi:carbonic anhydrase